MQQATITGIRAFNRYYTGILGLLDRHILNSDYSLPEARILYELGQREGVQASGIIESLGIDKGYLSRILDQFATKKADRTEAVGSRWQADAYLSYRKRAGGVGQAERGFRRAAEGSFERPVSG